MEALFDVTRSVLILVHRSYVKFCQSLHQPTLLCLRRLYPQCVSDVRTCEGLVH